MLAALHRPEPPPVPDHQPSERRQIALRTRETEAPETRSVTATVMTQAKSQPFSWQRRIVFLGVLIGAITAMWLSKGRSGEPTAPVHAAGEEKSGIPDTVPPRRATQVADAASGSGREPHRGDAPPIGDAAWIRAVDRAGRVIADAQVLAAPDQPSRWLAVDSAIALGRTDSEGLAAVTIPAGDSRPILVHHADHVPSGVVDVQRGKRIEVVLDHAHVYRARVSDEQDRPIEGARVLLTAYGRIDPLSIPSGPILAASKPRDSVFQGTSTQDGMVVIEGLAAQTYAVTVVHEGYGWSAPMLSYRGVTVPCETQSLVLREIVAMVLNLAGDIVDHHNIRFRFVGNAGIDNGWNAAESASFVRRQMASRFPNSILTAQLLRPGSPAGIALVDAHLRHGGWRTIEVPLVPLSEMRPTILELPATSPGSIAASGSVTLAIRMPGGSPLPLSRVRFQRREGHHELPVRFDLATDGSVTWLPPGVYVLFAPTEPMLPAALGKPSEIVIESGKHVTVEWQTNCDLARCELDVRSTLGFVGSFSMTVEHEPIGRASISAEPQRRMLFPVGKSSVTVSGNEDFAEWSGEVEVKLETTSVRIGDLVAR